MNQTFVTIRADGGWTLHLPSGDRDFERLLAQMDANRIACRRFFLATIGLLVGFVFGVLVSR